MVKSRIGILYTVWCVGVERQKGKVNPPICGIVWVGMKWYEKRRGWYEKYGMKRGAVCMKSII